MKKDVADYIAKQKPVQKEICLALRALLLQTLPNIVEEMKWGAIVYDHGRYYIGVVRYGVNFGFAMKGLESDDLKRFEGSGKTMRHKKIQTMKDIDRKELTALIRLVKKKAQCTGC